ncbi:hypothetical protein [Ferroplasma sp.]|uniref:hypothetical protein n=1 Tax=Ferroplasma sp. TaxID=2591003 RepID=UPI00307D6B85
MTIKFKNQARKLFSIPNMAIFGLILAISPDSSSSIVSGFYADGYAVDLFMLAIALAFITAMIIIKLRSREKS